ncbi:MAG TPA: hypothetical protein ACHBX0_10275 [Arsenophonus sp.]
MTKEEISEYQHKLLQASKKLNDAFQNASLSFNEVLQLMQKKYTHIINALADK